MLHSQTSNVLSKKKEQFLYLSVTQVALNTQVQWTATAAWTCSFPGWGGVGGRAGQSSTSHTNSNIFFYSPGHQRTLLLALQSLRSAKPPTISFCPTRTWYVFLLSNFTEHSTEIQHVLVMLFPVRPGNSITNPESDLGSEITARNRLSGIWYSSQIPKRKTGEAS